MNTRQQTAAAAPVWMKRWLLAAGVYNILWGAAMGLAPVTTLRWLGIAPADTYLWPQLWACIGMIVGVYGVGYAIASRDPLRHWPIVLVGLLGKILGPIGFVQAALQGQLPWSMGVTILTNDLIWWIPFAMILWQALSHAQAWPNGTPPSLAEALETMRDEAGVSLAALSDAKPTMVVLLRHAGCTFCRQAVADLADWQRSGDRSGSHLALVVPAGSTDSLRDLTTRYGLASASLFADPDRALYRALELGRGTFMQLFGPRVWINGLLATLRGHGIGKLEGDGFQMGGTFVIHRGKVLRAVRQQTAADRPDLPELSCSMN